MRNYLAFSVLGFSALRALAQCAMCTSTVDLQQNGPQVGQAFNRSIAFMLASITMVFLGLGAVIVRRIRLARLAQAADAPPDPPQTS